eukprot:4719310-Amphidinium_carterae.1
MIFNYSKQLECTNRFPAATVQAASWLKGWWRRLTTLCLLSHAKACDGDLCHGSHDSVPCGQCHGDNAECCLGLETDEPHRVQPTYASAICNSSLSHACQLFCCTPRRFNLRQQARHRRKGIYDSAR